MGMGNTKVGYPHQGHMPKMSAMPIYGKNPLKIFFSGTKEPMALGLVCSFGDMSPLKLTLTCFTEQSIFFT